MSQGKSQVEVRAVPGSQSGRVRGTLTRANAPFGPFLESLDELRSPTELEIIQNYQYRKTNIDGKRLTKDIKNRIFYAISSPVISIWEKAGIPVMEKHAVNMKLGGKVEKKERLLQWKAQLESGRPNSDRAKLVCQGCKTV